MAITPALGQKSRRPAEQGTDPEKSYMLNIVTILFILLPNVDS